VRGAVAPARSLSRTVTNEPVRIPVQMTTPISSSVDFKTFGHVPQFLAIREPRRACFTLLLDSAGRGKLTYSQLDLRAQTMETALRQNGAVADRALPPFPVGPAAERFDVQARLKSFGLSSLEAVKFSGMLRERPGKEMPATTLYEVQTPEELARIVFGYKAQPNTLERAQERLLNVDSLSEAELNQLLGDGDLDSYPVDRGEHHSNV
jgi:acyl carrier protein